MKTYIKKSAVVLFASVLSLSSLDGARDILNTSYDLSRELFPPINAAFAEHWKAETGETISVRQSHAGSSRQARSILEGLQADVVTFNQSSDVELLANGGLVASDWSERFPHNSSPYFSVHTIVVRKGNPKGISDFSDLTKPGVEIVQVNPKTGGNGRYAVLAYYLYALEKHGGDDDKAREFLKGVLANVVTFEQGGRGATVAFTVRRTGDVLVTFEGEAFNIVAQNPDRYEIVTPSTTVLSEFPIAVVESVAKRRGTEDLALAYLEFLYTSVAQEIIAQGYNRPRDEEVAARFSEVLQPTNAVEPTTVFGDWSAIGERFFANNALVDQLLAEIGRRR